MPGTLSYDDRGGEGDHGGNDIFGGSGLKIEKWKLKNENWGKRIANCKMQIAKVKLK